MTDETFIDELRQLKADLGPSVQMRVRWGELSDDKLVVGGSLLLGLTSRFNWLWAYQLVKEQNPFLCLYRIDAEPGALPDVLVDVPNAPEVEEIQPGSVADVHGIPQPGHAVVVVVNGHTFWPAYPARTKAREPRLP